MFIASTREQRNLYWCSLTSEVRRRLVALEVALNLAVASCLYDKLETLDSTRKLITHKNNNTHSH